MNPTMMSGFVYEVDSIFVDELTEFIAVICESPWTHDYGRSKALASA